MGSQRVRHDWVTFTSLDLGSRTPDHSPWGNLSWRLMGLGSESQPRFFSVTCLPPGSQRVPRAVCVSLTSETEWMEAALILRGPGLGGLGGRWGGHELCLSPPPQTGMVLVPQSSDDRDVGCANGCHTLEPGDVPRLIEGAWCWWSEGDLSFARDGVFQWFFWGRGWAPEETDSRLAVLKLGPWVGLVAGDQTYRACSGNDWGPPRCGCEQWFQAGLLVPRGGMPGRELTPVKSSQSRDREARASVVRFAAVSYSWNVEFCWGLWLEIHALSGLKLLGGGRCCFPGDESTNWEIEYGMGAASPCKPPHEYWDPRNAHFDSIEGEMSECSSQWWSDGGGGHGPPGGGASKAAWTPRTSLRWHPILHMAFIHLARSEMMADYAVQIVGL